MYPPSETKSGKLTLVFESPDRDLLDIPGNLCIDPRSQNIYMCEDTDYAGMGEMLDNYVRILTPYGKIADFAKNMTPRLYRRRLGRFQELQSLD